MALTQEEIKEIVRSDPHVIAIHPGSEWDIPCIDEALFSKNGLTDAIDTLATWARAHCIEDCFGSDHKSRQEWRQSLRENNKEDGGLWNYVHCNLGLNGYMGFNGAISFFGRGYVGTNSDVLDRYFQEICDLLPSNAQQYDEMATTQKLGLVRQIQQSTYNMLIYLSEQEF